MTEDPLPYLPSQSGHRTPRVRDFAADDLPVPAAWNQPTGIAQLFGITNPTQLFPWTAMPQWDGAAEARRRA